MLQRMRELAVQAASGTMSSTDIAALDTEFDQLRLEINRVALNTQWNGSALSQRVLPQLLTFRWARTHHRRYQLLLRTFNLSEIVMRQLLIPTLYLVVLVLTTLAMDLVTMI